MIIDPSTIYNYNLQYFTIFHSNYILSTIIQIYVQVTVLSTQICMNKYLFFRFREIG